MAQWRTYLGLLVLGSALVGCGPKTPGGPDPSAKLVDDGRFVDEWNDFALAYPESWTKRAASGEDVLRLTRADAKRGQISVAVPKLPPHIPGIIPLPSVEKGYVDDVKKRLKDVTVVETRPVKIDGAFGRRFVISGRDPGEDERRMIGVYALVKGDRLYMMSAESAADDFDDVRDAFEQIARSWKWEVD